MSRQLRPRKRRGQDMARDDGVRGDPDDGTREDAAIAPTAQVR